MPAGKRVPASSGVSGSLEGPLTILGRIMPASNHTFLASLGEGDRARHVVYKPVSGERPLWDFTDGSLAMREYAAFCVSEATGWDVVPLTGLREGPAGPGMVQLWQEPTDDEVVDLVPEGEIPPGFRHVLDATDGANRPVSLVHEDSPQLRRIALFDVLVNNTDRKASHILPVPGGHRYGVDHGVCFHTDDKLRTVLWGWAGGPLEEKEREVIQAVQAGLAGELGEQLAGLLTAREIHSLGMRTARLLRSGCFPRTPGGWPSIPWPPF